MLETLRIRDIREDNNLTQKRISEILNCTQQTYSRYETGEIKKILQQDLLKN